MSFFHQIVFDATFDSGSLGTVRALDTHRFLVRPRPDYGRDGSGWESWGASWSGLTWWYHFSITVPKRLLPYPIELQIDHSKAWIDRMYAADKVPVISCDGMNWRYVTKWEAKERVSVISETLTCPTTYVALATPYPWIQMQAYLASIATAPHIIRQEIIGYTPSGQNRDSLPLHYLLLTDRTTPQKKRNVVVLSGQHPAEVTNAWMLTGLVEFLLSDDAIARTLRQHFAFHIYPAVNPEGVKYGHYRRTADSPLNTNRAWNSKEVREIVTVRNHIQAQTQGQADYFFDLHGATRSQHFIFHFANQPGAPEFVAAVAARHPHVTTGRGQNEWNSRRTGKLARDWAMYYLRSHHDRHEPPLSFTPEGSYAQGSWAGAPRQATDWKALGAALIQAIYDVDAFLPRPTRSQANHTAKQ